MPVTFPAIRVGDPVAHGGLTVFPLFADPARPVDYELADEAINKGRVKVEEVSGAGSVPDLAVDNQGDRRVLFLEGEELVGAKQNRILNTTVLIAAHSRSKIPVSCVEAGRWAYKSRYFGSGGTHSPSMLRRVLKASVTRSVRAKRGHRSDQGGIWEEVARQQKSLGAASCTSAMSDTFESHRKRLDEFGEKIRYVEGAVGIAVAVHGDIVTLDVFDKPSTCRSVWNRLLSGAILDALEVGRAQKQADRGHVEKLLGDLGSMSWQPADPVGEGTEFRTESAAGDHASALVFEGTLVHASAVCAVL